jgi:hypothetical protein
LARLSSLLISKIEQNPPISGIKGLV